jgi:hypothetical protein
MEGGLGYKGFNLPSNMRREGWDIRVLTFLQI